MASGSGPIFIPFFKPNSLECLRGLLRRPFQRFNVQGVTGNESCFDIIGPKCIHYLTAQVQSGDLLKAGCSGVVEVPIPESCSSIYTDMITVNLTCKHIYLSLSFFVRGNFLSRRVSHAGQFYKMLTPSAFTSSTLESSSPFIGIPESFNSTNHSAVSSNAMQRTWPVMIVEIGSNRPNPGPIFSLSGCVQAVNSTSNNSSTGSTSSTSSRTTSSTTTSTSVAAGSNTATSAVMSRKEMETMNWSFGLLVISLTLFLAC
jgi:hypothetical protein